MPYTSTAVNNSKVTEMFLSLDTATNGLFGVGIILVIFVILLVSLKSRNSSYTFTTASFITFVFANLMYRFGILADSIIWIIVILLIGSIIALYGESKQ